MKIIDVSGFGHSGKTSVTDLLREVERIYSHHSSFEFGLIRLPDGILDLGNAITDNWSPIRSDFAVKRFKKLCFALSSNYSEMLHPEFLEISEKYINSLIKDELLVEWYDTLYSSYPWYKTKIKSVLKRANLLSAFRTLRKKVPTSGLSSKSVVYLIDNNNFLEKTKKYLTEILSHNNIEKGQAVVTNNAFEPFNPGYAMDLFDDAYCVVVDRDPRDIYLSALNSTGLFVPKFEQSNSNFSQKFLENLKKDFLGVQNIDTFIYRQKLYRNNVSISDNKRIIRIHYEDLVLNYEDTVGKLFKRLDIHPNRHNNKFAYFNPEESIRNVRLWKQYKNIPEIAKIEKELNDYLYE